MVTLETDGVILPDAIKKNLLDALKNYMIEATDDREVRYTKIGSIIARTEGVEDYKDLLVNGSTSNISVSNQQLPTIDEDTLIITTGTV